MLRVRNLDVAYGRLGVLRRVSLHVNAGEIVTLIGANGAGKSTLLRTVAGLTRARAGEILFQGRDVRSLPTERRVAMGCSLVPEGRQVFPAMPVKENLLLGATVRQRRGGRHEAREDLERVYGLFPVLRERRRQLAGTLSGGEQQMLAIGRALMARPSLVMLDEPSMGLAPLVVRSIFDIVARIRAEGATVLLVEQNARSALKIASRGYVLETGRIVLEGTADELLANRDVQRAYLGRDTQAESTRSP
jgi:branched-chain amino acid transport system ATP-binding protein